MNFPFWVTYGQELTFKNILKSCRMEDNPSAFVSCCVAYLDTFKEELTFLPLTEERPALIPLALTQATMTVIGDVSNRHKVLRTQVLLTTLRMYATKLSEELASDPLPLMGPSTCTLPMNRFEAGALYVPGMVKVYPPGKRNAYLEARAQYYLSLRAK